eukprot:4004227-Karenia_brevis.AAC.1
MDRSAAAHDRPASAGWIQDFLYPRVSTVSTPTTAHRGATRMPARSPMALCSGGGYTGYNGYRPDS